MNEEQHAAYDDILSSVIDKLGLVFFLHGPAGTGKTFLYNALCNCLRSERMIVLCVASSGIASLLLPGGRTAHSRFKIPIELSAESLCAMSANSIHADLLRQVDLIIWDEAPMQHRHAPEAVNRTLQDMRKDQRPFGGITTVFGGDMKQILPVIIKGRKEDIINATILRSQLWQTIRVLYLRRNMRLDQDAANTEFAQWLLNIWKWSWADTREQYSISI
jgi:AAA+ superfamily predicted ATPase